jgi:hypothetical protein
MRRPDAVVALSVAACVLAFGCGDNTSLAAALARAHPLKYGHNQT